MLIADDLHIALGKAEILRAVNAQLRPGTITAICGPNGAGKSTFLAALAGLLAPARGFVRLGGAPLAAMPARSRACKIGYLPQQGEVAWDVAVRNLVQLGRMPHGDCDAGAGAGAGAVEDALKTMALADLANRPMSQLSGGERARALLARVLAGQPEWILADEPLAALDLRHQLSLLGHLRHCAQNGVGVVMVVHDLALAMNHADHVLVLDRGQMASAGPPELALAQDILRQVWMVDGRWLGNAGARALSHRS